MPRERYHVCNFCVTFPRVVRAHVPVRFKYNLSNDEVYVNRNIMSKEYRNIKAHLKRYIQNQYQLKNVEERKKEENVKSKTETRKFSIGMSISRILYSMYKDWYSKQKCKNEVLKVVLSGTDLGNISHSKKFPMIFRPYVATEVNHFLLRFFGQWLEQTCIPPPINTQADKGESDNWTRQFTSVFAIDLESPSRCLG